MKERLLTLAGALAALYFMVVLLAPPPEAEPDSVPTTEDEGADGLRALERWLDRRNVQTVSLRRRLAGNLPPGEGHVFVMLAPLETPLRRAEREALSRWVRQGNTLILLQAARDRPEWRVGRQGARPDRLVELITGFDLVRETSDIRAPETLDKQELRAWTGRGETVALRSTGPVAGDARPVSARHAAHPGVDLVIPDDRAALALLRDPDTGEDVAWLLPAERGRMLVSVHSDLFANGRLSNPGNARFTADLFARLLGGEGRVLFDDFHQGLSAVYDPEAFFADARLHASLGFVLGFWLLWAVGRTTRLGPVTAGDGVTVPALAEAGGGFMARKVEPRLAAERLLVHFNNDVRRASRLPTNGRPVWDTLAKTGGLPGREVERLHRFAARLNEGRTVDLQTLQNTINNIRNAIS